MCRPQPDWTIDAVLDAHPGAAQILVRHGMACVGCVMARFETLADAAREYRIPLKSLLKELRSIDQRQRSPRPSHTARHCGAGPASGGKANKPQR